MKLKNSGVKITSYADDVVLLATDKFLPTVSELLRKPLKILKVWAKQCGLGINFQKMELLLFRYKRKLQ